MSDTTDNKKSDEIVKKIFGDLTEDAEKELKEILAELEELEKEE